jgi:predicted transcriptional regulator of viral defense system
MTVPAWKVLADVAMSQHNLFTTEQAQRCGVARSALAYGVRAGRLRRARRGVYAFNGAPPSRWESMTAAALAAGPDAVLSHRSAAVIHRLPGIAPVPVTELSVPHAQRRRLAGVTAYESAHLPPYDLERRSPRGWRTPRRTRVSNCG